ncbi:MAG TPA: adenylyl-sulfate kinase [Methylophilaceae bacterium]|nr:adenylyl-sulfate kinase [Methylophilaceae bacterium]
MTEQNIYKHKALVSRADRESRNGHRSFVLWFTGLSGAGKSTLAHAVEQRLFERNCVTFVFDGDNVRHGLCSDLGFSERDREENIRRIGEMAKLFTEAGTIAITAFISPIHKDRDRVRALFQPGEFVEVYCRCTLETCEQRDVKGLYAKARKGVIANFTGISSHYEPPQNPELVVDTDQGSLDECVEKVIAYLEVHGLVKN